jgi:hypothetical protein
MKRKFVLRELYWSLASGLLILNLFLALCQSSLEGSLPLLLPHGERLLARRFSPEDV